MIRAVGTAFGSEASTTLRRTVSELKNGDALAPVTVVVPAFATGLFARRSLGDDIAGIANLTILTLAQLAERIAGATLMSQGRRPAGHAVVAAALRRSLAQEPGRFRPVAGHPATVAALGRSFAALAQMDQAATVAFASRSPAAGDVARICGAARRLMAQAGWFDVADLIEVATSMVKDRGQAALASEVGPLIGYLLSTPTGPAIGLLATLGLRHDVVVIVAITGYEDADRAPKAFLGKLGVTFEPGTPPTRPPLQPSRVVAAVDPDDEVRAAVQQVVQAVRNGIPPGQQAILYSTRNPYALLIRQHVTAAGLSLSGPSTTTLAQSLVGRVAIGLMTLQRSAFSREAVCDLLASAPFRGPDGAPLPVAAWEAVSRRAGVVAGPAQWASRLAVFSAKRRADASRYETDDDRGRWQIERARRDADQAERFAAWLAALADRLVDGSPHGWGGKARWLADLVEELLGDERRRHSWPEHEQRAGDRIAGLLAGLSVLDALDPDPSLDTFRRVLEGELDQPAPGFSVPLGQGVLVGPVALAVGAQLARVNVVGLVEGLFPGRASNDALLPDPQASPEGAEHRTADQHRHLAAALASGGEVVLSYPLGDPRRSRLWQPSRWVSDSSADLRRSFAAGVATDPESIDAADAHLQGLYRQWLPNGTLVGSGATARSALSTGLEAITQRRSADFTRWDGNLAGLDLAGRSFGGPQSPTRLEAYARCPHAYFMDYVLKVVPLELPEELERISPLDSGQLLHRALETFLEHVLANDESPPSWGLKHQLLLQRIGEELCDTVEAAGLGGRALFWRIDRRGLLADLARFLSVDDDHRSQRQVAPWLVEYNFPGSAVTLPDGRRLQLRGMIDRVDRGPGRVVVIDYKSGKGTDYNKIGEGDPVRGGTALQLPLYGMVAAELARNDHTDSASWPIIEVAYWLVSRRGGNRLWSYQLDDIRQQRCLEAVAVIVDGIEAGQFPARPPARDPFTGFVPCRFCNPDGLGTSQARRRWERKRETFELAAYKRLVEDPWEAP